MNICIIGGGLSGLSAAYMLKDFADIDLFEKNKVPGGCLSSSKAANGYIEDFYHHCFSGDKNLISLIDKLGLTGDLEWLKGSTGYLIDGKINPLTTPADILKYRYLSLYDKFRLGMLTLKAGKMSAEDLDNITAKEYIEAKCGKSVYSGFFEPLLRSKFGALSDKVSAAWLISRIAIRSDRGVEGERLGYLKGGYVTLINRLNGEIESSEKSCNIYTGTSVSFMEENSSGGWTVNGKDYDAVISTVSPSELRRIGGPDIGAVPYQGAACVTIGMTRDVLDGIYWVNVRDKAPYGAVIGHTNFVNKERYGEHIVYLASYFSEMPGPDIKDIMVKDFCSRFGVKDSEINWSIIKTEPYAGPVYVTGYRDLIPEKSYGRLYPAGMFSESNYPERSMEGSVVAGYDAAKRIMRDFS
ncbi:NAD(P)/FAD-dependent oxidoreductase [Methanoplanus limicola]|uniref:Amine oxidase n=1 Tax=Methanoplanus limicola DSM 2279 TaxID=937775 RepID=H1Z495_9EURY|nr:NAD(P)/FAD-dependent oxidoreductase [Methanoplanus limicola]EHQ36643.1 amine oxidase [Methanoplanus limicola DSM 2279]